MKNKFDSRSGWLPDFTTDSPLKNYPIVEPVTLTIPSAKDVNTGDHVRNQLARIVLKLLLPSFFSATVTEKVIGLIADRQSQIQICRDMRYFRAGSMYDLPQQLTLLFPDEQKYLSLLMYQQ